MAQKFSDAARAPALALAIVASDTALEVTEGGALFPVANTGTGAVVGTTDWFKAVLQDQDGFEIVYVRTHNSGSNTFTNVLRAQEGTTARDFGTNTVFGLRHTAVDADAAANRRVIRTPSPVGAAKLPTGTTAERDASLGIGSMRYNSEVQAVEVYNGTDWEAIGSSDMLLGTVEFIATAGQTSFATSYTPGRISVYKNGAMLSGNDYTATNGSTVVIAKASVKDDLVVVMKFSAAALADAVAKTGDTMSGPLAVPAGATGNQVPRASEVEPRSNGGARTAAFTAVDGGRYGCNTTAGSFTVTLPASPQGKSVTVFDYAGTFDTNNLVVDGGGTPILGLNETYILDMKNRGREFYCVDATKGWLVR